MEQKMNVIEYASWFEITDEAALRVHTLKVAAERGELDQYHEWEQQARRDSEGDGGKFLPSMHALDYLIERGLAGPATQDEEDGFVWHGSRMKPLDLSEEDLKRRKFER